MEPITQPTQIPTNVSEQKKIPFRLKIVAGLLFVAYAISLYLPASTNPGDGNGLLVLMMGWLGPITGTFSWYANPFWVGAVNALLYEKYSRAIQFSLISILLASQYFVMYFLNIETSFIDSSRVVEPGSGYWLWVLVLVSTCIFSVVEYFSADNQK